MINGWEKQVVRRTMEQAQPYPAVFLHMLLTRLEHCPQGLAAIIGATEDMGRWFHAQAAALDAETAKREAAARLGEIVNSQK